jgi:hypothetical protein
LLDCVEIPYVDCEDYFLEWTCNSCVSWEVDEDEFDIVECYDGCNEESVEWGEVVVIESFEKYECVDLWFAFEDERKTDEENEGCELWYM